MSQSATERDNGYPEPGEVLTYEQWWIDNLTTRVQALPFTFDRARSTIRKVAKIGAIMDLCLQTSVALHHDPNLAKLFALNSLTQAEADALRFCHEKTRAVWTHYTEAGRRFTQGIESLYLYDRSRKALLRRLKAKGYVQSICGRIRLDDWDEGDWPPAR